MRMGTIVLQVQDIRRAAAFWSAALHYRALGDPLTPAESPVLAGDDGVPITLDETDRIHLDLHVDSAAEQAAEVDRLVGLGARRVDWRYDEGANHVVLADTEGNLFCIVNTGREDVAG